MPRNSTYTAIPSRKPKLLVPDGPRIVQYKAFDLYNPYSLNGRVLKWLARISACCGLMQKHVFWNGNGYEELDIPDAIQPIIAREAMEFLRLEWETALERPVGFIAFSLGTANTYQKVTTLLFDEKGHRMAVAKIGATPEAKALIRNEYRTLWKLKQIQPKALVPSALGCGATEDMEWMLQSPLRKGISSSANLCEYHLHALRGLTILDMAEDTLQNCPTFFLLEQLLEGKPVDIDPSFSEEVSFAEDLLRQAAVLLSHKHTDVWPLVRSHGDFAPWNMRIIDNALSVYDWECSLPRMPAGWDILRFVVMVEHLLRQKSYAQIYQDFVTKRLYDALLDRYSRYIGIVIPDRRALVTLLFLDLMFDVTRQTIVSRSGRLDD